jgi:hypothetical protein
VLPDVGDLLAADRLQQVVLGAAADAFKDGVGVLVGGHHCEGGGERGGGEHKQAGGENARPSALCLRPLLLFVSKLTDDRHVPQRRLGPDVAQELHAVHVRHHDIL